MIPFGALVWYKESGGKSFEPKGSPAIYLGPELINRMKYKGNHRVWALNLATEGILRECVVRTLVFPGFPKREVVVSFEISGKTRRVGLTWRGV